MRQAIATIVRRTAVIIRTQIIMMAIVPADIVPFDAAVVAVDVKTEKKQTSSVKSMVTLNIPKNELH